MSNGRAVYFEAYTVEIKLKDQALIKKQKANNVINPEYIKFKETTFINQKSIHDKDHTNKPDTFLELIKRFANNFERQKDKGIAITKDTINEDEPSETIYGEFKGGHFGNGKDLYETKNSEEPVDTLGDDKITAYNFYFIFWLPQESKRGLLIIQNFGRTTSCNSIFKEKIQVFVNHRITQSFVIKRVVSEEALRIMFNQGKIESFTIKKHNISNDYTRTNLAKMIQGKDIGVNINVTIDGIHQSMGRKMIDSLINLIMSKDKSGFFTLPDVLVNDDPNTIKKTESSLVMKKGNLTQTIQLFKGLPAKIADVMPERDKIYDTNGFPTFDSIHKYVTEVLLEQYKEIINQAPPK